MVNSNMKSYEKLRICHKNENSCRIIHRACLIAHVKICSEARKWHLPTRRAENRTTCNPLTVGKLMHECPTILTINGATALA